MRSAVTRNKCRAGRCPQGTRGRPLCYAGRLVRAALLGFVLIGALRRDAGLALVEAGVDETLGRDGVPSGPGEVALVAQLSRALFFRDQQQRAIEVADRALEAAERLDVVPIVADLLITRGSALAHLGRSYEGLGAVRAGIDLADDHGLVSTSASVDRSGGDVGGPRDRPGGLASFTWRSAPGLPQVVVRHVLTRGGRSADTLSHRPGRAHRVGTVRVDRGSEGGSARDLPTGWAPEPRQRGSCSPGEHAPNSAHRVSTCRVVLIEWTGRVPRRSRTSVPHTSDSIAASPNGSGQPPGIRVA